MINATEWTAPEEFTRDSPPIAKICTAHYDRWGELKKIYNRIFEKLMEQKQIAAEKKRLEKIYKNLPTQEKELISPLLSKYAFLNVQLEEWQEQIAASVDPDEVKSLMAEYNRAIKSLTIVHKEIKEKLPADAQESKLSKLLK